MISARVSLDRGPMILNTITRLDTMELLRSNSSIFLWCGLMKSEVFSEFKMPVVDYEMTPELDDHRLAVLSFRSASVIQARSDRR
jgi:hypothetical protein